MAGAFLSPIPTLRGIFPEVEWLELIHGQVPDIEWEKFMALFVVGIIAGGLSGVVLGLSAAGIWNTLVIPVWIFRQTRNPLVKVALGLNLVFVSMVLLFLAFVLDGQLLVDLDIEAPRALRSLASLAGTLGLVFCLAIQPKSRAQGVLYGSVVLQICALIIRTEEQIDNLLRDNLLVGESMRFAPLSVLLTIASFMLFVVFLKRLAAYVEAQPLVTRANSLLKFIQRAVILIGVIFGVWLVTGVDLHVAAPLVVFLAILVGFIKFFTLVRDLYPVILQKL